MSTQPKSFLTPEQYLEIERKAETRSEYYQGEMFAMAGASWAHVTISANVTSALHIHFRGGGCSVGGSDTRVNIPGTGLYTYPDVVAICGKPQFLDGQFDTLLNPTVIVEVLSPSTELYDRGRKFDHYKTIDSLRDYLLIASDRIVVDLFSRQPDGRWLLTSARGVTESVEIPSLNLRLSLADIYERVEFETSPPLHS
jgi:Uma2 family endonuclease